MRPAGPPVVFLLTLAFLSGAAGAALAQEESFSPTGARRVLPDPVPGVGADYPPSAATAGQGYVGPPLRKADPNLTCSAWNPCAYAYSTPRKLKGLELAPIARLDAEPGRGKEHG